MTVILIISLLGLAVVIAICVWPISSTTVVMRVATPTARTSKDANGHRLALPGLAFGWLRKV